MADTKDGRERQARNADRRQREREIAEARARADEVEPTEEEPVVDANRTDERELADASLRCHRRGCEELAEFVVLERYQEETGHGAVEAEALLCREHTAEEGPTNLDGAYDGYVFRVDPIVGNPVTDAT